MEIEFNKTYSSKRSGDFIVLEKTDKKVGYHSYYLVKFLETDTIKEVSREQVVNGSISDPKYPTMFGIGYFGNAERKHNMKPYATWKSMLDRCYNTNSNAYKNYGGKGVYVEKRWHSFENFIDDMSSLPGWDEELYQKGELVIDKDKKAGEQKYYGKDVCS